MRTMGKGWKVALTKAERELMYKACSDPSGEIIANSEKSVMEDLERRGLVSVLWDDPEDFDADPDGRGYWVNLAERGYDAIEWGTPAPYWCVQLVGRKLAPKYDRCYDACRAAEKAAAYYGETAIVGLCDSALPDSVRGDEVFVFEP